MFCFKLDTVKRFAPERVDQRLPQAALAQASYLQKSERRRRRSTSHLLHTADLSPYMQLRSDYGQVFEGRRYGCSPTPLHSKLRPGQNQFDLTKPKQKQNFMFPENDQLLF